MASFGNFAGEDSYFTSSQEEHDLKKTPQRTVCELRHADSRVSETSRSTYSDRRILFEFSIPRVVGRFWVRAYHNPRIQIMSVPSVQQLLLSSHLEGQRHAVSWLV